MNSKKKEGQGTLVKNGSFIYEGEFYNDVYDGYGRLIFRNGDVYEGEFLEGQPSGFGILTKQDSEYEGEFKDGLRHGFGTEHNLNGYKYKGDFH